MTMLATQTPRRTPRRAACVFCSASFRDTAVLENRTVVAVPDAFPVAPGHHLVLPRRHAADFFDLTAQERADTMEALDALRARLLTQDPTIEGFNVGMNCGPAAGQTVPHAHTHLIPRRRGDTPDPRGGVRGAVPARMSY